MWLRGIFDLLFWSVTRGDYGALVGAIGGTVSALGVFLIPSFLETGVICESDFACDDLKGWIVIIAVVGASIGAILGALLGLVGIKFAPRILGPDKEKVGAVVGGLIGGIAPWAILSVLYLISSG